MKNQGKIGVVDLDTATIYWCDSEEEARQVKLMLAMMDAEWKVLA